MTFKTFTWPENPSEYEVVSQREPVYTVDENGNAVFSGLGAVKRTVTGSGVFTGEDAYTNFKTLAALFAQGSSGILTHPIWDDCTVYFTQLKLNQQPRLNYVAYSFEFREADSTGAIPK